MACDCSAREAAKAIYEAKELAYQEALSAYNAAVDNMTHYNDAQKELEEIIDNYNKGNYVCNIYTPLNSKSNAEMMADGCEQAEKQSEIVAEQQIECQKQVQNLKQEMDIALKAAQEAAEIADSTECICTDDEE